MDEPSPNSPFRRVPARQSRQPLYRVVSLDPRLRELASALQTELPTHRVMAGADVHDAHVFVTDEIDAAVIRRLQESHPALVIVVCTTSTVERALLHRTFIAAINAGASAYLVDAPVPVVATHVENVGRRPIRRYRPCRRRHRD